MYTENFIKELEKIAAKLRVKSLDIICKRGAGHPGGALSAAEIITALYFNKLRIDPKNPKDQNRDIFVLSKGHSCAILYCALALRGFFSEEDLNHWGELDCHLQGHPDRNKTRGIECSTGTLGNGFGMAIGLAISYKLKKANNMVYVLLGDGECQSGVVWEGAMASAKFKLNNLIAIVDFNGVQLDGPVSEIMPIEPFAEKWKSFNWEVLCVDGHNIRSILEAFDEAFNTHDRPTVIIAKTIKGKGVSFMENQAKWHGIVPSNDELSLACQELMK